MARQVQVPLMQVRPAAQSELTAHWWQTWSMQNGRSVGQSAWPVQPEGFGGGSATQMQVEWRSEASQHSAAVLASTQGGQSEGIAQTWQVCATQIGEVNGQSATEAQGIRSMQRPPLPQYCVAWQSESAAHATQLPATQRACVGSSGWLRAQSASAAHALQTSFTQVWWSGSSGWLARHCESFVHSTQAPFAHSCPEPQSASAPQRPSRQALAADSSSVASPTRRARRRGSSCTMLRGRADFVPMQKRWFSRVASNRR